MVVWSSGLSERLPGAQMGTKRSSPKWDHRLGVSQSTASANQRRRICDIVLFSSRSGNDGGLGRLTRFTVDGEFEDLEVSDNTSNQAVFLEAAPTVLGNIIVDVAVSPDGTGRFCYLGVLELERR